MKLRPLTAPGIDWPVILPPGQASPTWSAFLELTRTERLHRDAIGHHQSAQLRQVLQHCRNFVPYYRDTHAGCPDPSSIARADLSEFPVLSRAELRDNLSALTANRLPAGQVMLQTQLHTAGSTGEPVTVNHTNLTDLWFSAMCLRTLDWAKLEPRKNWASIRWYPPEIAKELQEGARAAHIDPRFVDFLPAGQVHIMDVQVDPQKQIEWLAKIRPDYLMTFPSNLQALCELNCALDEPVSLEAVLTTSEPMTKEIDNAARKSFGAEVVNVYSAQEVGYIAAPCFAGAPWLHVMQENVLLEVVHPETHEPLPPGETGKVLLTTLQNFATPLVRYDIGDTAALMDLRRLGGCPHCQSHLQILKRPEGKVHPLFVLPDGSRKNSMQLAVMMRQVGGTKQFRLTQQDDHVVDDDRRPTVRVDVVPDESWDTDHRQAIYRELNNFFGAKVKVVWTSNPVRIPPTKSGKSPALLLDRADSLTGSGAER